jgi:hypothetical protein
MAVDAAQVLGLARIANAENNHNLDVDAPSDVARRRSAKSITMSVSHPRPRQVETAILKAVLPPADVVASKLKAWRPKMGPQEQPDRPPAPDQRTWDSRWYSEGPQLCVDA